MDADKQDPGYQPKISRALKTLFDPEPVEVNTLFIALIALIVLVIIVIILPSISAP